MNYKLSVESQIWNKDTNSLFDYESINYFTNSIEVYDKGKIYLHDKTMKFLREKDPLQADYIYMCTIKRTNDNFYLYFDNLEELNSKPGPIATLQDRIWLILRHTYFHKNSYRLKEGDILKIGKIIFRVKEIFIKSANTNCDKLIQTQNINIVNKDVVVENEGDVFSQNQAGGPQELLHFNNHLYPTTHANLISKNLFELNTVKEVKNEKRRKKINQPSCRICLNDDNEASNPLINPCSCAGTMKYIHLECLKHWLNSRLQTKSINHLTIYSFKNIQCEICKHQMPEKVKIRNEVFNLIEYAKPDSSYLVCESHGRDKGEPFYVYVMEMREKTELSIGRSNESDIRMPDISVSRNHATIKLINNCFYIEDSLSKFGTLIQINSEILLLPNKILSLQLGKSFTSFKVEKTCLGFFKCIRNTNAKIIDYNDFFNEKWNYIKEIVFKCDEINESQVYSEGQSEKCINDLQNVKTLDFNDYNPECKKEEEEKKDEHQILFSNAQNRVTDHGLSDRIEEPQYQMIIVNTENDNREINEIKISNSHKKTSSRNNNFFFEPSSNVVEKDKKIEKKKKNPIPKNPLLETKSKTKIPPVNLKEFTVFEEKGCIPMSARKSRDSFRSSEMVINSVFNSEEDKNEENLENDKKIKKIHTNYESDNYKLEKILVRK